MTTQQHDELAGFFCDCCSCDDTRRTAIKARCEKWFAENFADEPSGVRCAQTIRPPKMARRGE